MSSTPPIDRRFIQCDVFSPLPAQGNGLAVVVDGEGLTDAAMQGFAAWTSLAETTFLLPPTDASADYRVRIFTPKQEMPFAGHPTLGSCMAWLACGGRPRDARRVVQQCPIGLVPIDVTDPQVPAFAAPPTRIEALPAERRDAIARALGIAPDAVVRTAHLVNGPAWQVLELASADAVLAADASKVSWPSWQPIGLVGPHPAGGACDFEVRMLAPSSGMLEDPITGSLNAALARWFQSAGRLAGPLAIAQGTAIGRHGRVAWRPDATGQVWIGGHVNVLIRGQLHL